MFKLVLMFIYFQFLGRDGNPFSLNLSEIVQTCLILFKLVYTLFFFQFLGWYGNPFNSNLSEIVQTCLIFFKLAKTCSNWSELVQIGPNWSRLVKTCSNWSKLLLLIYFQFLGWDGNPFNWPFSNFSVDFICQTSVYLTIFTTSGWIPGRVHSRFEWQKKINSTDFSLRNINLVYKMTCPLSLWFNQFLDSRAEILEIISLVFWKKLSIHKEII